MLFFYFYNLITYAMATTSIFLDLRGKAKDGLGTVVIRLLHNRTSTTISTKVRVKPEEWNGTKVVGRPDARQLNAAIQKMKTEVDSKLLIPSIDSVYRKSTASEIKAMLLDTDVRKKRPGTLLQDIFEDYKKNNLKSKTIEMYDMTMSKIINFSGEDTLIQDINYKWLVEFDRFLAQTMKINSKAIYLRALRSICNYAVNMGITESYPFKRFSIKQEQTIKRSVPVEVMREFMTCPVTSTQGLYRDYFFLVFFLIGINMKDLLYARHEQVIDGRLEYIREKTGKRYSIKIEPEAQRLLNKYRGKRYLVKPMDTNKDHKYFLRNMNKFIGCISHSGTNSKEMEPVISGVTSYYARHSWATYAYEIGIPMDVISQALGHSFANKTTLIYVKSNTDKVDEANRKVIDYLLKGL